MMKIEWQEQTCGFCREDCSGGYSTYSLDGEVRFRFCRNCLNPDSPTDEQRRHCAEMILIIVDRAIGEGGNVLQLPGHA